MYKIYCDGELMCDPRIPELAIQSPVVTLDDGCGTLSFILPLDHPRHGKVKRLASIVEVYLDNESQPLFRGICKQAGDDFYKNRTTVCEGELTYLNDSIQRQAKYTQQTLKQLITKYLIKHNEQVDEYKQFKLGTIDFDEETMLERFTNYQSTMKELQEDVLDNFGGAFYITRSNGYNYFNYTRHAIRTSSQVVKLGVNLLDYKSNIDDTNLITQLIPLGARQEQQEVEGLESYLTVKSVNDGSDLISSSEAVASFGKITGMKRWDGIKTASNLLKVGKTYLQDNQFENVYIECKVADLGRIYPKEYKRFRIFDSVHVVSAFHGMDRHFTVTKMVMNLNEPQRDTITLGKNTKLPLSKQLAKIRRS